MDSPYNNELIDALVTRILATEDITLGSDKTPYLVRYRGRLRQDSETAYDQLAGWLKPHNLTPLFRWDNDRHVVLIVPGKPKPNPSNPMINLIMAILILAAVLLAIGIPTSTIRDISPDLPAAKAGLLPGDKIVQIEDVRVREWDDITDTIVNSTGDTLTVAVDRGGKILSFEVGVTLSEDGRRVIGIGPAYVKNPGKALIYGAKSTVDMTVEFIDIIGKLVTGKASTDNLTGPVGIVLMVGGTAKLGWIYVAQLTALISLNLAIVNMLPFPALDGGRLLFLIIRLFTGKAISDETEGKIHFIGLMLLFCLMIYITAKDIIHFDQLREMFNI